MSAKNKYTNDFKKTIVNLYHSGKSYAQIHTEYGVSSVALSKCIKLFSEVKIDDDTVIDFHSIGRIKNLLGNEKIIATGIPYYKSGRGFFSNLVSCFFF